MCLPFLFYRSEQAPAAALLRAHLDQHVATLQEHDNSIKEEVAKPSEVFPVKNMNQTTRVSNIYFLKNKFQVYANDYLRK